MYLSDQIAPGPFLYLVLVIVYVTDISRKGDGIARIQGFVIFIENGKVGHRLKVKVTEVADRFAKATIV